jgi:cell wall assembly regulator SMI1
MVPDLIDRMDRWLRANRPDYYARLRPGVDDARLDEFERQFGVTLPEAFRLLYKWRDGQDAMFSQSLVDGFSFEPLDEAARTKALLDGMIGFDFEDPKWWRRGWIPFLHNGGGDFMCLDLAAEDGGTPGHLLTFWHDDPRRAVRADSMTAWLTDLVESMEGGTLRTV